MFGVGRWAFGVFPFVFLASEIAQRFNAGTTFYVSQSVPLRSKEITLPSLSSAMKWRLSQP
jgi:hypothetical protein